MYCRRCQYDLRGQADPICPECGRPFDPGDPTTFRLRPKRKGVAIALTIGMAAMGLFVVTCGLFYVSPGSYQLPAPTGVPQTTRTYELAEVQFPDDVFDQAPPIVLTEEADPPGPSSSAADAPLVTAARHQVGVTVTYDPAYVGLAYPGGDVPIDRGVCTDVVIRAMRQAYDIDLQRAVHEDMSRAFSKYPTIWGLSKPDRNIDHRRVPNLVTYFERQNWDLPVTQNASDYLPGDIVTCTVGGNRPHIMIVSDRRDVRGTPRVIHNIGRGAREESRLFEFPMTGHYRVPADDL